MTYFRPAYANVIMAMVPSHDTLSRSTPPFCPTPVTTSTIACRPTFAALPEEIIVKILEWCDLKGVLTCQLTCRALRDIIVGSISLRYKLALSEHGMCDGTSSDLSTAEKLELLTAHADAWQSLDTACPEKADILVGWSAPIAVSCNVMVFSRHSRQPENHRGKWNDEDAEVMAQMGPRLSLLVLRVPSALRRVEAAHWVLDLPGNASHPLAERDVHFGMWDEGDCCSDVSNLCVCGDFVAGVRRVYFISVWNWKTGQLVSDLMISEVNFSSFDFLDEHHILYAVSTEDSIYVYDLRRGQQKQKQPQKEKENEIGPLRFHLALPPINRGTTSRYIQLRRNALPTATGPLPDWRSWLDDGGIAPRPEPATPPFHTDPHERLIVVRITTSPVERGEEQFELHVPARAFLEHFSSSATIADTGGTRQRDDDGECKYEEDDGVVVVPWTAWCNAARATPPRKLPYTVQARMIVYGMRALSYPPDWNEGVLHIDSYLPRARRREGSREAGADTRAEPTEAEPAARARRLIHCRAKSRMHIGTPFKMGNEWVLHSLQLLSTDWPIKEDKCSGKMCFDVLKAAGGERGALGRWNRSKHAKACFERDIFSL
ncbi:hypothetical protein F5888DRAFT_1631797 [Russula emetica]|nr:hypothetical protein F5888DRAFT_1631797 [Russula emetica]